MTWPNRFYLAALICASLPLAAGGGLALAWLVHEWDWLPKAGFLSILGGVLSVVLGCLLLVVSAVWSLGRTPLARLVGRLVLALVLLATNFPLGYMIAKNVCRSPERRAKLLVANDGPTIENFSISGACVRTSFGSFKLGDYLQKKFAIKRDGKLEFHALQGGRKISGVLAEHLESGAAPEYELTFNADGSWAIEDLRAHYSSREKSCVPATHLR